MKYYCIDILKKVKQFVYRCANQTLSALFNNKLQYMTQIVYCFRVSLFILTVKTAALIINHQKPHTILKKIKSILAYKAGFTQYILETKIYFILNKKKAKDKCNKTIQISSL